MENERKSVLQKLQGPLTSVGLVALAVVLVFFFSRIPSSRKRFLVGEKAPQLRFEQTKGKRQSLADFRGQVVLLNFWAQWCGPCVEEMPSLRNLERKFSSEEFSLLAIHVDGELGTQAMPTDESYPTRLIYRFEATDLSAYQIGMIPVSVLVDKNGIVRQYFVGPRDWLDPEMIRIIRRFIKQDNSLSG